MYVSCPGCRRVFSDQEFPESDALDRPCPACGETGDAREVWPPFEANLFLKALAGFVGLDDPHRLRATTLFLAAACENLMGLTLWDVMMARGIPNRIIEHVMRNSQGRNRMLQAYEAVAGRSVQQILDHAGMGEWGHAWNAVAAARNTYAHGGWRRRSVPDTETRAACDVLRRSFHAAFAALNNSALDADS